LSVLKGAWGKVNEGLVDYTRSLCGHEGKSDGHMKKVWLGLVKRLRKMS
jgi:hypothetical protein